MAINNKPASTYAKPHTMTGGAVNVKDAVTKPGNGIDQLEMSIAGSFKKQKDEVKTSGIKQRGHGAATKGYTSRGPMA
jgi:hypothetical protein